jgi:phosphoribosylformimino-5-aminoimidazole carboxamide ribotide isomerase
MKSFTIFPAIDLRFGKVVRLSQGDPNRQKTYSDNPASTAQSMLDDGARWLHVVNLDATFGESASTNLLALQTILKTADDYQANVQFGGGLHSIDHVKAALSSGVSRVVLGSLAAREPNCIADLLKEFDADQIAVSLDSLDKKVMVSGWRKSTNIGVYDLANQLRTYGLRWLVYTDIKRDGMQIGSDFETTISLFEQTKLNIIASGGVSSLSEINLLKNKGVSGAIIGRAFYEGTMSLPDLLKCAAGESE